jgi:glycosyltransferase involved in cell wall biosynthesis
LDQRIANYIEKRYLRSLDGWIAVSHTTLANVERLAADEQRPFVVAHPSGKRWENTPSISEVRARAQQPGPLRIVFLANLIPRKGLHVLLSALRSLPRDAWQLAVIGGSHMNSAYMERIRKIIGEYRLDDNLNLTGWINTQELASALREHHLLVVPSSYEGFGLVYLEGMGLGLPAIASTQGAAHEIITHGKNGYLLEYGDVQALAQTIYILHTDRTLLAQISENALAHYAGTPSWEDTGAKLLDFITAQAKR